MFSSSNYYIFCCQTEFSSSNYCVCQCLVHPTTTFSVVRQESVPDPPHGVGVKLSTPGGRRWDPALTSGGSVPARCKLDWSLRNPFRLPEFSSSDYCVCQCLVHPTTTFAERVPDPPRLHVVRAKIKVKNNDEVTRYWKHLSLVLSLAPACGAGGGCRGK